jgi:hypothetical protein
MRVILFPKGRYPSTDAFCSGPCIRQRS